MYTEFFGFTCKPFQLTPDPEFLFMSRVHKRALTYLNYGVADNSGFILITGEIGTGKTTIIRSLIKKIPQEIKIARINNTKVNSIQLISMINEDFGIDTRGDDKTRMLSKLTNFLINQYAKGGRSMIIIDEAQNLSAGLLEEIRMLSNLETDKSKLLQIILIGQPELNGLLARPELEQLRQRIAVHAHINALSKDETEAYILHRLRVAGNEKALVFEEGSMDAIYAFTKGIPRVINVTCDYILLAAYADGLRSVNADLVKEITDDLTINKPATYAVIGHENEILRNEGLGDLAVTLSAINLRLRNLEIAINEMLKRNEEFQQIRLMVSNRKSESAKKDEDLLHREYRHIEKEDALRENTENIKYLFE